MVRKEVMDLTTGKTVEIVNTMEKKREEKLSTVPFCIEEQKFYYTPEMIEEIQQAV